MTFRTGDRVVYNRSTLESHVLFGTVGTVISREERLCRVQWETLDNRSVDASTFWHADAELAPLAPDTEEQKITRPVAPCPDAADPLCPCHRQSIVDQLRTEYPHGHADYILDTLQEIALHSDKNHDYAGGGDPLGNFDRVSAILQLYPDFPTATPTGVALTYALKQLDAVLWGLAQNIQHVVEGLDARLQDISVYAKLARIMLRRARS